MRWKVQWWYGRALSWRVLKTAYCEVRNKAYIKLWKLLNTLKYTKITLVKYTFIGLWLARLKRCLLSWICFDHLAGLSYYAIDSRFSNTSLPVIVPSNKSSDACRVLSAFKFSSFMWDKMWCIVVGCLFVLLTIQFPIISS